MRTRLHSSVPELLKINRSSTHRITYQQTLENVAQNAHWQDGTEMQSLVLLVTLALMAPQAPVPLRHPSSTNDAYALVHHPAGLEFLPGSELRFLYRDGLDDPHLTETRNGLGLSLFGTHQLWHGLRMDASIKAEWPRTDSTHLWRGHFNVAYN